MSLFINTPKYSTTNLSCERYQPLVLSNACSLIILEFKRKNYINIEFLPKNYPNFFSYQTKLNYQNIKSKKAKNVANKLI